MKLLNKAQIIKKLYSNVFERIALEYNITANEVMILTFLKDDFDQDMATDIVNTLMISKSHVSLSVNNLEKAGYIVKKQDVNDKKKIHLVITEKAKPILDEIDEEQNKLYEVIFKGISKEEKEILKLILQKMCNNINEEFTL